MSSSAQPFEQLYSHSADGERLLRVITQLVEPIGRSLPSSSEVALHDLSLLPNSIVAIYGEVTHRAVGGPATDLLLRAAAAGELETRAGYETELPDGRRLRSSTMIIRDDSERPVAALCINSELDVWQQVYALAASMIEGMPGATAISAATGATTTNEVFVRDVDELASLLLKQAIEAARVPVELMRKHHKIDVVRTLKHSGMFMLRDATETIAAALNVTRFTIYNYLNEIGDEPDTTKKNRGI